MNKIQLAIIIFAANFAFVGCASTVKTHEGSANVSKVVTAEKPLSDMTITLTPEAKKKLEEGGKGFNPEKLMVIVRQNLEERKLLNPEGAGDLTAEMVITDVNVRSVAAAVMFGFLAGSDRVAGDINFYSKNRKKETGLAFTYTMALGGLSVSDQDRRFNMIYNGVSEEIVKVITGTN
jgi:hypothetical protein